jgi:hypothetical protein
VSRLFVHVERGRSGAPPPDSTCVQPEGIAILATTCCC